MGLHPSKILVGYEKATEKITEIMDSLCTFTCKDVRNHAEV